MNDSVSRLLDLAIAIQQIPAPTFHEGERAAFVRECLSKENLRQPEVDAVGNVYARLGSRRHSSAARARPVVVTAHLDTVFPKNTDLTIRREPERLLAPGIGDNSLGVAGLFGLIWALHDRNISLPGDLWLVANVCEEGLGNLRGMKAVVERFGPSGRNSPLAYVILEGMALGQVYQRGLGVRRFRIRVHTAGGHSWHDYGQPSAVHELTAISARITSLELPQSPRTSLNVGVISGGSTVNTIASEAMLELDLRSENTETLEHLARKVESLVDNARKPGVKVEMEAIGQRPSGALPERHPLVRLAQDCLLKVGLEPRLNIGSTDANLPLSLGLPAITIGLTTGGKGHTLNEFINIPPLEKGLEALVTLVSQLWDQEPIPK